MNPGDGFGIQRVQINAQVTNEAGGGILDEFRAEFLASWHRLPNKSFFFSLLAAWVALFHIFGNSTLGYTHTSSLFTWLYYCYNPMQEVPGADDAHGNFVPFVVLGLLWWKRKHLLALELKPWWPSLFLLGLGLLVHLAGYAIQQPRLSVVGFFVGVYGLTGLAWGWRWLAASFFPFILFGFSVPLGSLAEVVTAPLRHWVAAIVAGIAHLGLAPDLVREGTQIFDRQNSFHYDIAPACSGIRSLISLMLITAIYGAISFDKPWKRAVIFLSAFPLAIIGNVARLTFTVMVAEVAGHQAGSAVETNAGFVTFAVAIGLVLALGHWLRERPTRTPVPAPKP